MRNVAPSYALVRRSRQLLLLAFLTVSVGIFIAVIGLALFVLPLAPLSNQGFLSTIQNLVFLFGVFVGIIGLGMAVRAMTWKTDNDLAMITGSHLSQFLDDRYTFIRNVSRLGLGYIDAVLVGPPGALVFRILDNTGIHFNEGANWMKQNERGEWVPMRLNPTRQAVEDIRHLREYFVKRRLPEIPVYGVIAFTHGQPTVQVSSQNAVVPSAALDGLMEVLNSNYLAQERIDQPTVDAVIRTLYTP
jgi:hypothetical protein